MLIFCFLGFHKYREITNFVSYKVYKCEKCGKRIRVNK